VIAGDLNIDAASEEFTSALRTLNAQNPARVGHPFSYDPGSNSVAAYNSPDGPRQQLDHVLLLNGHTGPRQWTNETRAVHSPEWTVGSHGEESYTDFSDHYPVFAHGN
jgi:sphingomyelin phosphodiesterase